MSKLNEFWLTLSPMGILIVIALAVASLVILLLVNVTSPNRQIGGRMWIIVAWFFLLGGLVFSHPKFCGMFQTLFWDRLGATATLAPPTELANVGGITVSPDKKMVTFNRLPDGYQWAVCHAEIRATTPNGVMVQNNVYASAAPMTEIEVYVVGPSHCATTRRTPVN